MIRAPAAGGNRSGGLRFRFYTEEYPEFATGSQPAGRAYNDAFLAELDTSNWDTSGTTINAPNNFALCRNGGPIGVTATVR